MRLPWPGVARAAAAARLAGRVARPATLRLRLSGFAAAAPLPPRDFEAPEAEDQAGLRVPQTDLQRLGARPAAAKPGEPCLGTSPSRPRLTAPAAASDGRVLDALRSVELRRLVRTVDSAPDGEAVRCRALVAQTCSRSAR